MVIYVHMELWQVLCSIIYRAQSLHNPLRKWVVLSS